MYLLLPLSSVLEHVSTPSVERVPLTNVNTGMMSLLKCLLLSNLHSEHYSGQGQQPPNLANLPPELLFLIDDFLTTCDSTCLALCNRAFRFKLGTASYETLRGNDGSETAKQDFLQRFARDHPRSFFCHTCGRLHSLIIVGPPGAALQRGTPRRLWCLDKASIWELLHTPFQTHGGCSRYRFAFQHLQIVMVRHRLGHNHGMSVEALCFKEVQISEYFDVTTLLSVEPRIVDGELFLRVQQWMFSIREDFFRISVPPIMGICVHFDRTATQDLFRSFRQQLQESNDEKRCSARGILLRCQACATEFQLETKVLQLRGSALLVTKWLNLGRGEDPQDPAWRRHLWFHAQSGDASEPTEPDSEKGVRAAFETQEGKLQDELTSINASTLSNMLYRTTFERRGCSDTWVSLVGQHSVNRSSRQRIF